MYLSSGGRKCGERLSRGEAAGGASLRRHSVVDRRDGVSNERNRRDARAPSADDGARRDTRTPARRPTTGTTNDGGSTAPLPSLGVRPGRTRAASPARSVRRATLAGPSRRVRSQGRSTFTLAQSLTSLFAMTLTSGSVMASGGVFSYSVPLSGELDCLTGAFHAAAADPGAIGTPPSPTSQTGNLDGQIDRATRSMSGVFWIARGTVPCVGSWSAQPSP